MQWSVAEAKQAFSQLLREAAHGPQLILNRGHLVAAVLDPVSYEAFEAWQLSRSRSLAEVTAALRAICAEEDYALETPPRTDRANPFAG